MTVSTTSNRITYTGNGSTTVFAFPYKFTATADIKVYLAGVLQSSGYTVGTPSDTGANVTFGVAPASSASIVLVADPARTQSTSLPSTGPFPAKSVEAMSDKLTLLVQRLYDLATRSLTLSDADTTTASTNLPSPEANKLISWNASASGLQNVDVNTLATIVSYGTANSDVFTGDGATKNFTLSANPGTQANLDVDLAGITQTAGIDFTWTSGTTLAFVTAPPLGVRIHVRYMQALAQGTIDSSATTYTPAGTGAVATTVQTKLRESVSAKDFGAKGDGVTDDTAAIAAALTAAYEVIVPVGMNLKITSTVTVPAKTKLRFLGGETNGGVVALPSFITKSASMTTAALALDNGAVVEGGGLICTAGNTGDGVYIYGNSAALRKFHVYGAGGNGVRVGSTDTSGAGNTNSFELYKVVSEHNTGSGFLFNDSSTLAGPNANAGTIYQCFANANGGDGFRVQHSFWNTFINCLSETNTGYGLYFSGTLIGGYSEARYHTVLGGDYNEGNTAGVIYNLGYKCLVINPDTYTKPTPSNGTGYEGGYLAGRYSTLYGLELVGDPLTLTSGQVTFPATQVPSANANTLDDYEEGTWTPVLTFQTPGNLSVTYSAQVGRYTKVGNRVTLQCNIVTSAFTFTTATGYLRITGLPYAATTASSTQNFGALLFQGVTKAGYTNFVASVENALTDSVLVYCSGSGVAPDFVKATDTPTGGTVQLKFTITYESLN